MKKLIAILVIPVFIFACTLTNESAASDALSIQAIKTQQPASTPVASPTPSLVSICHVQTNVDNGQLNLRAGPGTQYAVIVVLHEGDAFTASTFTHDWVFAKTNDHQGWINFHYTECHNTNGGSQ